MTVPVFSVVGHPNKGKSSIVATLSQDESVQVSPIPGTTVRCRHFPMKVDDEVLYMLVDTPGFQRARKALAWMRSRATSASENVSVVRQFVDEHQGQERFIDECELLKPLIDGAGILYVIDGSRPYGDEYEAEMEILRWSGQPSMALINLIGEEDYVDEWTDALSQYFKIVRVFNAVTAEFHKRIELLSAFGQLKEEWNEPLNKAVRILEEERSFRRERSARAMAEMLADMLTLTKSKRVSKDIDPAPYKDTLEKKYKEQLRRREQECRQAVESNYEHHGLLREEAQLEALDEDLMSLSSWNIWGLTQRQLLTTGAAGGAAVGVGVDIAVGGASLLLGAAVGSIIGGTSAWVSFNRISDVKVMGLPLGGTKLNVGPMKNINFPYVVLGRALFHHAAVARRTHAQRDVLALDNPMESFSSRSLSETHRKRLEGFFRSMRNKNATVNPLLVDELATVVNEVIAVLDKAD